MFDFKNLVGVMMQSGVSRSGMDLMKHAMGDQGLGGQDGLLGGLSGGSGGGGDLLSGLAGGGQSGGGLGGLADMAKNFLGGGRTGAPEWRSAALALWPVRCWAAAVVPPKAPSVAVSWPFWAVWPYRRLKT